jgi:hypothetical protein
MNDTTERQAQIQTELAELEKRTERLKAEAGDLAAPYPAAVRDLAERLHGLGCNWDHTEGCAWHYDTHKSWPLRRGRVKAAGRVRRAEAAGYEIDQINHLLDLLPEGDIAPARERVRAPGVAERRLVQAMQRVFRLRYEGSMLYGQGWIPYDGPGWGRASLRWSVENDSPAPWSGLQHRRYLAAARAWSRATGWSVERLADLTEHLDAEGIGWGC